MPCAHSVLTFSRQPSRSLVEQILKVQHNVQVCLGKNEVLLRDIWIPDFVMVRKRPPVSRAGPPGRGPKSLSRMAKSSYSALLQAWTLSALPMLILPLGLLTTLLLSRPSNGAGSSYSGGHSPGNALYSKVPATQLTFVSSLSSTLATALLPAMMALFSFVAASGVAKNSDSENVHKLASPYQLSMLIDVLSGSLGGLWSFLKYLSSSNRKSLPVIPDLWRSVTMFALSLLVAFVSFEPSCHLGTLIKYIGFRLQRLMLGSIL